MENVIYTFIIFVICFLIIKSRNDSVVEKINNNNDLDLPLSFGYKVAWMAIKTETAENVIEFLPIESTEKSNWKNGLKYVFDKNRRDNYVFISPSINGWVFIIGYAFSSFDFKDNKVVLSRVEFLSKIFNQCYCFCNDRVSDYYAWIIGADGNIKRALLIGQGEIIYEKGDITAEEKTSKIITQKQNDLSNIDEDDVLVLAESWSFNPMRLEEFEEKKFGFIARLKD